MAELRLAWIAALAIGCRAEADPGSGLAPPPGWQPLRELADAARAAAVGRGLAVEGSEAWGDTARGCYGAWIAWRGHVGAPAAAADALLARLATEPALAGIEVRALGKPSANADTGIVSAAFERAPYRGTLRAAVARRGHVALLACFWTPREPVACEAACTRLVGSMP